LGETNDSFSQLANEAKAVRYHGIYYLRCPDRATGPNLNQQDVLSTMAVAFFAIVFVVWWVFPDLIVKKLVQQIAAGTWTPAKNQETGKQIPATAYPTDASRLLVVNQTRTIIAAALLEGTAFFACIAYLVERQIIVLAVPGAVRALMVLTFPTRDRVGRWVDTQQTCINDSRSGSRA
jgi:hypothetical protein